MWHPAVSLVVISRDDPDLDATLTRLRSQCREADAQLIVVDSSEGRAEATRLAHPEVRWIDFLPPLDRSTSIPQQRNAGVAAARGSIIAFCDGKSDPKPGWLAALVAPIREGRAAATCGPITASVPGVFDVVTDVPDGTAVIEAPSGNLAFSQALFARIGPFDERYGYGSDVDWTIRAYEAGSPVVAVRAASLGMDWGGPKLWMRRAWRYGIGRARLVRLHPHRVGETLRHQPAYVVYSMWIVGAPAALAVSIAFWIPIPAIGWASLLGLLALRNRHASHPLAIVADHLVKAAAFLAELTCVVRPKPAPLVLHFPYDPVPYEGPLIRELNKIGVRTAILRGPTRSRSLNLALLPGTIVVARARGMQILHLHWTWGFIPRGHVMAPIGFLCRAWFVGTLSIARACGVRIVYTAHNLRPHEPVFDDDDDARRSLVARSDAIIAHHETTAADLRHAFGAQRITVIPAGVEPAGRHAERGEARRALGISDDRLALVALGRIAPYKGLPVLFAALDEIDAAERGRIALRVAGQPSDASIAAKIGDLAERASAAGVDIDLRLGQIDEEEYATYLAAADLAVFPFTEITNSASVPTALAAGVPALIAGHASLADLPDAAVVRYDPQDGPSGCAAALREILARRPDALAAMGVAARRWATGRSWAATALATRAVYAELLRAGR